MPSHVYPPRHNPPSFMDRLLMHTSDAGVSALLTVPVALQVILAPLLPGYEPSNTLDTLSVIASIGMAVMLGAGGVLATMGLFWSGHVVSTGWALERCGWIFVAGGWSGFSYMALMGDPSTTLAWYIPGALSLMAWARLVVIVKIEHATRPAVEAVKEIRGEGHV